jgi:LPXTG-motif cell wall-anchored protein
MKLMNKRRILAALLCACMAIAILPGAALAATGTRNGIELTLETEKPSYAPGETIVAQITAKNTNLYSAYRCKVELTLPDGLTFANGTNGKVSVDLTVGRTGVATFKVALKDAGLVVPKTGGEENVALWVTISICAALALSALLVFRKRATGTLLCILLCAVLLTSAPAAALAASKTLTVTETVKINGQEYPLTATLYYELGKHEHKAEVR